MRQDTEYPARNTYVAMYVPVCIYTYVGVAYNSLVPRPISARMGLGTRLGVARQKCEPKSTVIEMSLSKAQRVDLTLKQKVDVIKAAEKEPSVGVRELAKKFQCGKTQVATILKNKVDILQVQDLRVCRCQ